MECDLNGLCPSRTLFVLLIYMFNLSFHNSYTKINILIFFVGNDFGNGGYRISTETEE